MWKGSRFNVSVPSDDGYVAVVNMLNRGVLSVPPSVVSLCEEASVAQEELERLKLKILADYGFLVPEEEDEHNRFHEWYQFVSSDLSHIHCTVSVTSACNLACPYCFEKGNLQSSYQTMSRRGAVRLVEWLDEFADCAQSEEVVLYFYGGEPTLVPELLHHIVAQARKRNADKRRLSFGIYTNAAKLSESLISLFRADDFRFAQVSLDGPEEVHNRRRLTRSGEHTFEEVWRALELLSCECRIQAKVVVNFDNDNYASIPSLLDLLRSSRFGHKIQLAFNPVFVTKGNQTYCMSHVPPERESYHMWKELHQEAIRRGLKVSYLRLLDKGPCSLHRIGHFFVSPSGKIFECIGLLGMEEFATADVNTRFRPKTVEQRRKWLERISRLRSDCVKCPYVPLCLGGCRFKALCETGNVSGHVCHKEQIECCELPLISNLAHLRNMDDEFDSNAC